MWLLRNVRREQLCARSAAITGAPPELVEDALQEVCLRASTRRKCRGRTEGEVYNWLLKATLRQVVRLLNRSHMRHEVLVDWRAKANAQHTPASDPADVELLAREREREVRALAAGVIEQLDEPQRQVVALHCRGLPRREIAERLRIGSQRVKYLRAQGYDRVRQMLVEASGGGCRQGERLVSRLSFGLANSRESKTAQLHMTSCERCASLYRRLELVHEKIAALLPVPTAPQADPALVERLAHKTADALAQAKQQLADTTGLAKQHAAASLNRAAEYSPLASARPGAAATTAIAGCLALAGGTATYCVENNVNPVTGLVEAVQREPAKPKPQPPRRKARVAQQIPDPPQLPPVAQPPPPAAPTPTTEPAPAPAPAPVAPAPAPAPAPEPPPPPPEPTPAGVQFGEPATPTATQTPVPAPKPARPAPVPASGGSDLYGP